MNTYLPLFFMAVTRMPSIDEAILEFALRARVTRAEGVCLASYVYQGMSGLLSISMIDVYLRTLTHMWHEVGRGSILYIRQSTREFCNNRL